jgi:hypothetical protein
MSDNQVIDTEWCESGRPNGFIKLYARGRFGLLFSGSMKNAKAAEKCFRQALEISVNLNVNSFARAMRDRGISEKEIHEFLDNCTLVDEVHLGPILN